MAGSKPRSTGQGAVSRFARLATAPAAAALLAGGVWWLPQLDLFAAAEPGRFVADPAWCEVTTLPQWLPDEALDGMRVSFADLGPIALREPEAVEGLAARLARCNPWIRSVDRIDKRYPDRLEVEVTLRQPVALLDAAAAPEPLLVAEDGVLLCAANVAGDLGAGDELPRIRGVRAVRGLRAGDRLTDPAALEGLLVALDLRPHHAVLHARGLDVLSIDVAGAAASAGPVPLVSGVELRTRHDIPIEWGRSSTGPPFGVLEPKAEVKVRELLKIVSTNPELTGIARIRLQAAPRTIAVCETAEAAKKLLAARFGDGSP